MYFINPSHQIIYLYVYPSYCCLEQARKVYPFFTVRQRLGKHVSAANSTRYNRRIVGRLYKLACICIPLLLLRKNSAKTFHWKRRIVGGLIFYAVCVVTKECGRLVLPRTSCLKLFCFDQNSA